MVGGIYGGYNASAMYGMQNYLSQQASSVNNFDYKAAQKQTQAYIDQYKQSQNTVTQLKKDSANFLDSYQKSLTGMDKAASAVQGQNLEALLYGKAGRPADGTAATPTQENVDKTAEAVQKMVDQFNSTLKTMNDNASRGPGVEKQIARMVSLPTSERSMEQVGITVNKDGTLKVDSDKLKTALKENTSVAQDVIGGSFGMARGIQMDAQTGLRQTPSTLIARDLASMKQQQMGDSLSQMGMYSKSGVYNMANLNSVGVLMNMLI